MKKENQEQLKKEYFTYVDKLLGEAFERAQKTHTENQKNKKEYILTTIWNFIQSRRIRRRNYMTELQKEELKSQFMAYAKNQYKQKLPIIFYLFDLPIKTGQNQNTDLGEEIMLKNLENIALNIEFVYPYGVQFIILCDGDIFSLSKVVPHQVIKTYLDNINTLIHEFSLSRVSIIDWHTCIFKNANEMEEAFKVFKETDDYTKYLHKEVLAKTSLRCKEIAGPKYSKNLELELLQARAFFEKNKKLHYDDNTKNTLGFKVTKGGFKRSNPAFAIYPADPNIETSVSRGITKLSRKESGVIIPILIK